MKIKLLFFISFILITKFSFANELSFQFQRLSQELQKLKFKAEFQSPEKIYKLDSVQRLLLRQNINSGFQISLSLNILSNTKNFEANFDYVTDIADDADAIEQVNTTYTITDTDLLKVISVNEDLIAKKSYADKKPNAPFTSIYIVVNTKGKKNKIVDGYEVWYVKKLFLNDSTKYRDFLKTSSPVGKQLRPGNYFFWTRLKTKKDEKLSSKQFKEFTDEKNLQEIDVSIF